MRKTVVTWVCDICGKESEPLQRGITFTWDFNSPDGWVSWSEPPPEPFWQNGVQYLPLLPLKGLGNDPALVPEYPQRHHFCCEEHHSEFLAKWLEQARHRNGMPYENDKQAEPA